MPLSIDAAIKISELPFIQEVSLLKEEVNALRPLDNETEQKIIQKFRLLWNYHSNAIEGNQLTYGETYAFLMEGVTAKGKTLKDHLDIKGHDETVKYLFDLLKSRDYEITESEIRNLHKMLLKEPYEVDAVTPDGKPTKRKIQIGEYKSQANHVITASGEIHYYATPQETPIKMGELMAWYKEAKENTAIHPLVIATLFHHEFTNIHPFDDGNGRMGRLLLNLMVQQYGYTPIVVKQQDRIAYYQVLRQADAGEYLPINEYMSELMKESLSLYIKGAKGESIEEEDDIDKEIMLFKKGLGKDVTLARKTNAEIRIFIQNFVVPFIEAYAYSLSKIKDLFLDFEQTIQLTEAKSLYSTGRKKINNEPKFYEELLNKFPIVFFNKLDKVNHFELNKKIETLEFEFKLSGYKKVEKPTNIYRYIKISIKDEYYYTVFDTNDSIVFNKKYGYYPTKHEISSFINEDLKKTLHFLSK